MMSICSVSLDSSSPNPSLGCTSTHAGMSMKPNFWGRMEVLVMLRLATIDSVVVQWPKSRKMGLKLRSEGVT